MFKFSKKLFFNFIFQGLTPVVFLVGVVWAQGLAVNPGNITVNGVPLGKKVAVSDISEERTMLSVENKSDIEVVYTINILKVAATTSPLSRGFKDIVDTGWIFPEEKEVRIGPRSEKKVELYIYVPRDKKFAKKKYQAIIEVKSKKNNPSEIFVLACQLRIWVETGGFKK